MTSLKMTSTRPVVFFDVALGESALGRIKMELFSDITPKFVDTYPNDLRTLDSFVPVNREWETYHRDTKTARFIVLCSLDENWPDRRCRGGDFINEDGTGSYSIYGGAKFQDENFTVKHDQPGLLSMANSGPNTNGCQTPFLDGKHTVFGKVVEGMLTLRKIENVQTGANNKPKLQVRITRGFWFDLHEYNLTRILECGEM
ncbi:hypothetical protein E3P92_00803 [Wallemia ichthyophaga]|uniref:Peptidyl-prolyl cis-trans isomerase n=1 Tax=Wallemia ichthyophaga TaxID=245174 RepID=A0A4T0JRG6_WALIC|nr:hypothetical protein E3P91_00412 [Wallemia ichthyophaga]TIA83451.1 hypothetical protein E3P98_00783 [Wallemia ichthyophaga]TIA93830.1 hypothetical protein E3P97_00708 [Wallemia ichthyophaga]TIB03088.1 hypothetical protein E3P95_00757 [Wallemia ichthyophaga]TIB03915.1 hypothetical protein E3P94_00889 [Wallemia ichthyophaga]